jgi:hypothetical protein
MPITLIDYKGLDIVTPDPTGEGGLVINDNFKNIADRIGPSNYTAIADPTVNDDESAGYFVGSRWLNTATNTEFICSDNTTGAAVWVNPVATSASIYNLEITTTDATPTELLIGGAGGSRLTIPADSAIMFEVHVVGRNDNVNNQACSYSFKGSIKRDGANNTSLVTGIFKEIWEESLFEAIDCEVTADDVNESLKIEVTGDLTTIKWKASVYVTSITY